MLREVFDPIPHEIEARQQFVRLIGKTDSTPSRSGNKVWVHAGHAGDSMAYLRREFPDYPELIAEWHDWATTWAALVARNPPLELRRRMGEVFDSHLFNSWEIGWERLFYDWLARGTRDPMPFLDNRSIVTEECYRRLCVLRDLAGGWFYWRNHIGQVVFVPLAEWEVISASWPSLLEQACADVRDHAGP